MFIRTCIKLIRILLVIFMSRQLFVNFAYFSLTWDKPHTLLFTYVDCVFEIEYYY